MCVSHCSPVPDYVQLGSGWLDYINGYMDKATDVMDFKVIDHFENKAENATYRERLPPHPNTTVEKIHSATVMVRDQDQVVMYAPPSRVRQCELFLMHEGSQIDNPVAVRLRMALSELLHNLMVAADYRQLQPIEGGGHMLHWWLDEQMTEGQYAGWCKWLQCQDAPNERDDLVGLMNA